MRNFQDTFEDVCSPVRYRGRFYPERRKIRNLITYVKIDQENIQHFASSCREEKFISHQGRAVK